MTSSNETTFIENSEIFINGSYNGVDLIIRNSDKYCNAGHLCKKADEDFYNFRRGKRWSKIVDYWTKYEGPEGAVNLRLPTYDLKKGYNLAQGTYVHPDLIHFVAEWISMKYAFSVKHIMDSINERSLITGESFEDIKDEIIQQQKDKIAELEQLVNQKQIHISKTSVPISNCDKKLSIKYCKDKEMYKLTADSTRVIPFVYQWIFPASMSIRQVITKLVCDEDYYIIPENLNQALEIIRSFEPKSETINEELLRLRSEG